MHKRLSQADSLNHVRSAAYWSSVQLKSGARPVGELLQFLITQVAA